MGIIRYLEGKLEELGYSEYFITTESGNSNVPLLLVCELDSKQYIINDKVIDLIMSGYPQKRFNYCLKNLGVSI